MSVSEAWIVDAAGSERALAAVRGNLQQKTDAQCLVLYFAATLDSIEGLEDWCSLKDLYLARLQLHFTVRDEPQELPIAAGALDAAKLDELLTAFGEGVDASDIHVSVVSSAETRVQEALRARATGTSMAGHSLRAAEAPAGAQGAAEALADGSAMGAAAKPEVPPSVVDGYCQVTATLDGRTRHFGVREGETVLDAGERAGLALPFSCRSAVCATCRTRVTHGSVEMAQNYALEPWEVEAGFILACQAHPVTPELSVTYDER